MAQRSATEMREEYLYMTAKAVGYDIVKVTDGHLAQPLLMISRRLFQPALDDHTVARAGLAVAGGAENVEALLAAL